MKFNDSVSWIKAIQTYAIRTGRMIAMPVTTAWRQLRALTQPNTIASKVSSDVMDEVKKLKEPEHDIKKYYVIGGWYVSKILCFFILLAVILIPALFLNYVFRLCSQRGLLRLCLLILR